MMMAWHNRIIYGILILLCLSSCGPKHQVEWSKYSDQVFEDSMGSGQPTLLYFYAAWCGPCHAMKERTFSDLRVIEATSSMNRIKVDMSFRRSEKVLTLGERFMIRGVPTMILYDVQGQEIRRVSGFLSSEGMLSLLGVEVGAL